MKPHIMCLLFIFQGTCAVSEELDMRSMDWKISLDARAVNNAASNVQLLKISFEIKNESASEKTLVYTIASSQDIELIDVDGKAVKARRNVVPETESEITTVGSEKTAHVFHFIDLNRLFVMSPGKYRIKLIYRTEPRIFWNADYIQFDWK
jgi:hypothetical protein